MVRALEIGLFLSPVVLLLLWVAARRRGLGAPSAWQLGAVAVAVAAMAAVLFGMIQEERLPPGRYVPAQLEGGRIVRGHSE